jgi:hypothetical protein
MHSRRRAKNGKLAITRINFKTLVAAGPAYVGRLNVRFASQEIFSPTEPVRQAGETRSREKT